MMLGFPWLWMTSLVLLWLWMTSKAPQLHCGAHSKVSGPERVLLHYLRTQRDRRENAAPV